jgi:class 3 adenylate cyclase/tetratricopeptide (TPR) repeat protein
MSSAGARRERKVVTVLFADLVGFTSRAEQLDPEDVEAFLGPYHERLRSELQRFGGTVEKFIGDAVMALFGAPVAHEDDPERAVRAALAIRDWARAEEVAQVRIAVNTGEALVNLGARPDAGEGMAAGDVVNTTARMQSSAPVNGVLVGETTYRATEQVIDYRPTEQVHAKGKAAPVTAWEALQARSRLGVDVAAYQAAPLVGRERELAVLSEALERAVHERSSQLVTIVGVPGIGKSRLVYELLQVVTSKPELVVWRQGRSLPYGEGVSLWSLAEMVKAQAGILDGDTSEQAAAKLARAVEDVVEDEPDWVLRHLRPLVGLSVEGEGEAAQQTERFAAWRQLFESMADRRPVVLVFEDLHWADEALLDFVDHLAEWSTGVPLLLVGTTRPELLEQRPAWGGGKLNATTLALSPLSDTNIAQLVHSLLDRPVLEVGDQAALVTRAGGNPLYAEQYVRMVGERGHLADSPLPENVQGIIAARLDGLSPWEKTVLQDAAVIGKVFWTGALTALESADENLDDLLHGLERKDFVERARRSSVAGSTEFAFRHVLVRDVAYGQIPRSDRSEKHRRVAEWFESVGRPEDHAETLAFHCLTALELARAAGQDTGGLQERARVALVAAADRAASLNAFAQAIRFYREGLELWPADDPSRSQVLFRLGRSQRLLDETGADVLAEAVEGLLAVGDLETAAEAEAVLGDLAHVRGDLDKSADHLSRAAKLTDELPPSSAKAYVLSQLARFHLLAGDKENAVSVATDALAVADPLGLDHIRSQALNTRGTARVFLRDPTGIKEIEEGLALAVRTTSVWDILRGYTNLGAAWGFLGDFPRAHEANLEGMRVTERLGAHGMSRWSRANLAGDYLQLGEWDEALRMVDEFIAEVEAGAPHVQDWVCRWTRGEIRLARGDEAGALADFELAVEASRTSMDASNSSSFVATYARVLLEIGQAADVSDLFEEVLSIAETTAGAGLDSLEAAYVARRLGREDEMLERIQRLIPTLRRTPWVEAAVLVLRGNFGGAAELYAEMGVPLLEAMCCLYGGETLVLQGRPAEADKLLQRGLAFFRKVGATRYIRRCEALLAASA